MHRSRSAAGAALPEDSASACSAKAAANASTSSGLDREPSRGAVSAEADEVLGAGGQATVQVERAAGASRAFPVALAASDQHDRAVVALDEPGSNDPDHALVPAPRRAST